MAGTGQTAGADQPIAATGGVLRARLAAAGGRKGAPAALPAPPPPSVERGIATAVTRAAHRTYGLQALAERVAASGISLAELPELLPEGALLAIIEGPGERLGVVALCPAVIASLIEMQAMRRISARLAPARRATRTDAAIAADFVNLLVEELMAALGPLPAGAALAGFRYASYVDDPRPLGMMLEDAGFHGLTATLRLGPGGERRGTVMVVMPGPVVVASLPPPEGEDPSGEAAGPLPSVRATLADSVRLAPVPLVAVLCRQTLSLRELRALQPGAMLTLPKNALHEVMIETGARQTVAQGRLGEADGAFAVRLKGDGASAGAALVPGFAAGPVGGDAAAHPWPEPPIADLEGPDLFREGSDSAAAAGLPMLVAGPGG